VWPGEGAVSGGKKKRQVVRAVNVKERKGSFSCLERGKGKNLVSITSRREKEGILDSARREEGRRHQKEKGGRTPLAEGKTSSKSRNRRWKDNRRLRKEPETGTECQAPGRRGKSMLTKKVDCSRGKRIG